MPEARAEAREARRWLGEPVRPPGPFARSLKRALQQIREFPESGSPGDDRGTRSLFVLGFKYAVVYVLEDGWATVIAVAHTSRRPGYWRDRLD